MVDWIEFRNTYLQLPWLFPWVISDRSFDAVLAGKPREGRGLVQRVLERLLWFWPRVVDATMWAVGEPGRPQTPENYMTLDKYGVTLLDWVKKVCPDRDAPIADIGCNCGRHVIELAASGYRNLTGVDAMQSAIALFAQRAPAVFGQAKIHNDLFQRFLMRQADRSFDTIYSQGSTIELVHPSFDVVAHMARVTRRHICLVIQNGEAYRRNWLKQFASQGFSPLHVEPMHGGDLTLLVLQRVAAEERSRH